jgi:hypothetical protein
VLALALDHGELARDGVVLHHEVGHRMTSGRTAFAI